jgi:hypothetical protein
MKTEFEKYIHESSTEFTEKQCELFIKAIREKLPKLSDAELLVAVKLYDYELVERLALTVDFSELERKISSEELA